MSYTKLTVSRLQQGTVRIPDKWQNDNTVPPLNNAMYSTCECTFDLNRFWVVTVYCNTFFSKQNILVRLGVESIVYLIWAIYCTYFVKMSRSGSPWPCWLWCLIVTVVGGRRWGPKCSVVLVHVIYLNWTTSNKETKSTTETAPSGATHTTQKV